MKLLEQSIQRNLELGEDFLLNHSYKKAAWKFYVAHAIALGTMGINDPLAKKKERVWKTVLRGKEGINSGKYARFQSSMTKDMLAIIEALRKIEEHRQSSPFDTWEYYRPGRVGMLLWEYPKEDN